VIADVLLQRAAVVARIARDRSPDPLAGLKVDDDDVERLLAELPGLESHDRSLVTHLEERLATAVEGARAELRQALAGEGPFARLVTSARLGHEEGEVLAVICAVEMDPRRQRLVAYLNDDVTQRRLTPFSLSQLWGADAAPQLSVGPGGPLQRAALLSPSPEGPWASTPVMVAPAVVWWLTGGRFFDPDLPAGAETHAGTGRGTQTLVTAAGTDRLRRLEAAAAALRGSSFLVTPVPEGAAQWDAVIRQATMDRQGVILEIDDGLARDARDRIERADHLAWAMTSPRDLPLASLPRGPWHDVKVASDRATSREWTAVLGPAADSTYPLSAEQLQLVGRATAAMGGDVSAAVRRLAAGHIESLALRVRPSRTWDDIVLEKDRMARLREVAMRCRHRDLVFGEWGFTPQPSTGVVALFAGPSGTGKTLAAEVIAGDLGIDLYKIDLANLVSKYIGETEKNLAQIFDAAEASNVALFFDEADALLGKRSDVSDAHDRYANIEVAYLLQRLERYEGLAVLATNLAKNIDEAFLRRLHIVVDFPMPDAKERRQIWDRCLPKGAPTSSDLDLDFLAEHFDLSGGTIRNAALTAAFLAAEARAPISMAPAIAALRRELHKLGRLVNPDDFGPYARLIAGE
jgi:SpoVK/Ycf46/Vps4 family AAA+-type ATPase